MEFVLIAVAFVCVLCGLIAMQPAEFKITRSVSIDAPAHRVFALVNDFHEWEKWSPWAKLDPAAVCSFEGPGSGVGAIFRWSGNHKAGAGAMAITESEPGALIRIRLDLLRPFTGVSFVTFAFRVEEGQTKLRWSMTGQNNFIGKAVSLVANCDKMVGGHYEQGLAAIKALAEQKAA